MTPLPSYIDVELWSAFVESRKAMKVPFTQAAQKLVIRKLMKLHETGWDANASLEKSIIYGYRGVFEVSKREVEKKIDPALQKIAEDEKKFAPMPMNVREALNKLKVRFP
jgi:hypothetical protein